MYSPRRVAVVRVEGPLGHVRLGQLHHVDGERYAWLDMWQCFAFVPQVPTLWLG